MTAPPPVDAHRFAGPARIAGAAALIAALTVLARLVGFGRMLVFLRTVEEDQLGNLYQAANTVPNILFELVAGGALASLVVPLLAGAAAAGDRARVAATTSALLGWALLLLVPLAGLVAVLADPISAALLTGRPAAEVAVAADMLRVFALQLPLYGIGIVLTGVLQAHHRFAWPVMAPLLSSLTVIVAYLTYAAIDGPGSEVTGLSRAGELTLSVGTTLGVVVLSLCLVVPVRRLGLPIRPALRFPAGVAGQVLRLGWAGAVTVGAQQVVLLVVLKLSAGAGGFAVFTAAQAVFLLPWAVLAVPVATAAYPTLAAARDRADKALYRDTLARTARTVMLLSCLGAAALVALAGPAAVVIAAPAAAPGIVGFAPGLLGYGLFALLSRALYARGDTALAAAAVAAGWAAGAATAVALAAALPATDRVSGLAAANSIGMLAIGGLLAVAVRRRVGRGALARLGRVTLVGVAAAAVAAGAGWAVSAGLGRFLTPTPWGAAVQGMLGGVAVVAAFVAVAYPLDRRDARPALAAIRGRLTRGRPPTTDREEQG